MKTILILFSILALAACSSGGGGGSAKPNGGGGVVTEFGKKIEGEWTSECVESDQGPFKDLLVINANGTGQRTITVYQNQNCSGVAKQVQGPKSFTYGVEDQPDGSARVSVSQEDGVNYVVNMSVFGNTMDIEDQSGKFRYIRRQTAQTPTQGGDDFDRLAIGIWMSQQCYPYQNNTSVRQQLTVQGRGAASIILQIYQSQDCSGRSRAERPQNANYRVDHFANGQGQITVNNEPSDVSFQGARNERMTITDANGTTVFNKVN